MSRISRLKIVARCTRATVLVLVVAAVTDLSGQGLLEDLRNLVREKELAARRLTNLTEEEPRARAALDDAGQGVSLADLSDGAAVAVAKRAVDAAARILQENSSEQAQMQRKLEAILAGGRPLCQRVDRQVASDRSAIERRMRTDEMSQDELEKWTQAGEEAQQDAAWAAVRFMADSYARDMKAVRGSISSLNVRVKALAGRTRNARKDGDRAKFVNQLLDAVDRLDLTQNTLVVKFSTKYRDDVRRSWDFVRDDLHDELRAAQEDHEALGQVLTDPEFKDAFIGDDLDAPGLDAFSLLVQELSAHEARLALGYRRFERMTGPTVRAFTFVRDALYTWLLSDGNTDRVLQQNDLAGQMAIAGGTLQRQYKTSIEAQVLCRRLLAQ